MGILVPALTKLLVSYPNLPHSLCTWTDYTPYRPEVTSAASPLLNLKPMIPLANKPFASGPGDLPTALPKTGNPASKLGVKRASSLYIKKNTNWI
jgi:hypothetical protein